MNLKERIQGFVQLGIYLEDSFFTQCSDEIHESMVRNPWFTKSSINKAILAWSGQLNLETLHAWLNPYRLTSVSTPKRVLVLMAGNIPLVGFHDLLSVVISGHKAVVKLSSTDSVLIPLLVNELVRINPLFEEYIEFVDHVRGKKFDSVIATGRDQSAQYFEYYFKDLKKIIRKNRRSIAVLDGTESVSELNGLANDVFLYFGLGCRNVSKLFLPYGYDLNNLFEAFYCFNKIIEHKKYANNYDYNKAVFLMGKNKIIENGFLLLKEDSSHLSPVAMLYYEYYDDISIVERFIKDNVDSLQCVVSKEKISFGSTQNPSLWDYADGVDTIEFLKEV